MTTISEAKEAIYQAFNTGWSVTGNQFTFENEDFTPPVNAPWARLSIRHNSGTQDTLGRTGNRRFERGGAVNIQIFTPQNIGVGGVSTLATTVKNIFEGVSLSGTTVIFRDVIFREIGPSNEWYQMNVEAEFNYYETR